MYILEFFKANGSKEIVKYNYSKDNLLQMVPEINNIMLKDLGKNWMLESAGQIKFEITKIDYV